MQFCSPIGARLQIALNLGSGTPEEAAAWVRYADGKWGDRCGGLLWELGNGLWGTFQIGYPMPERIAERTKAFSDVVRKADRRASIIGTRNSPDRLRKCPAQVQSFESLLRGSTTDCDRNQIAGGKHIANPHRLPGAPLAERAS